MAFAKQTFTYYGFKFSLLILKNLQIPFVPLIIVGSIFILNFDFSFPMNKCFKTLLPFQRVSLFKRSFIFLRRSICIGVHCGFNAFALFYAPIIDPYVAPCLTGHPTYYFN